MFLCHKIEKYYPVESHLTSNLPKDPIQFAVLWLVPALDLMIELMTEEAALEPMARSVNDYTKFVNILIQN